MIGVIIHSLVAAAFLVAGVLHLVNRNSLLGWTAIFAGAANTFAAVMWAIVVSQ